MIIEKKSWLDLEFEKYLEGFKMLSEPEKCYIESKLKWLTDKILELENEIDVIKNLK